MLSDLPFDVSLYDESYISAEVSAMSAIVSNCTNTGFVISADGLRSLSDDSPKESEHLKTDRAQKIFPIQDETRTLVYAFSGLAGSDDDKFNVYREAQKCARQFSRKKFDDATNYAAEFSRHLIRAFNKARSQKRLTEYPKNVSTNGGWLIGQMVFAGYFQDVPSWIRTEFFHKDDLNVKVHMYNLELRPNPLIFGSHKVVRFMYPAPGAKADARFSQYARYMGSDVSLDGAADFAENYIKACSDPVALQEDYEVCRRIGGKIHTAAVTPEGFRWITPPIPEKS